MLIRIRRFINIVFILAIVAFLTANVSASHTPSPSTVTIAGSFQSELGAAGDWQPDAVATQLTYDSNDDVWQGTFNVPAGNYEYKVALNDSWDENYGLNATANGANIPLNLSQDAQVKFYYDHKSHLVTSNFNSVIATVAGDFQSEIGGSADWDPSCLRSWLQDPDGDGIYEFTANLPVGSYECKVAINESWDENYGQGGVPNGSNIPFTVAVAGPVHFSYNPAAHILTISKILTGITITSPPEKTIYAVGESLDLAGLVVTGNYNDGTTEILPITMDNISGFDSSAPATDQVVTVTVDGKTATFTVDIIVTQPITKIRVTGIDNSTKVKVYSTLQMIAIISPKDASYKSVTWSVINGTGSAVISPDGLLTGVSEGNVTVIATANDGSGVKDKCNIRVTSK